MREYSDFKFNRTIGALASPPYPGLCDKCDKTLISPIRPKKDSAAIKKIGIPPQAAPTTPRITSSPNHQHKMASVYKSISKSNGDKAEGQNGVRKNKQRVLILSSRGVTYR